jgi:hypothetical protein
LLVPASAFLQLQGLHRPQQRGTVQGSGEHGGRAQGAQGQAVQGPAVGGEVREGPGTIQGQGPGTIQGQGPGQGLGSRLGGRREEGKRLVAGGVGRLGCGSMWALMRLM